MYIFMQMLVNLSKQALKQANEATSSISDSTINNNIAVDNEEVTDLTNNSPTKVEETIPKISTGNITINKVKECLSDSSDELIYTSSDKSKSTILMERDNMLYRQTLMISDAKLRELAKITTTRRKYKYVDNRNPMRNEIKLKTFHDKDDETKKKNERVPKGSSKNIFIK